METPAEPQEKEETAAAEEPAAAESVVDLMLTELDTAAHRAKGLMDRTVGSATYGCADRNYWYYRTLTNFPGATWQQVMVGFAALYVADHPANKRHRDQETLELANAALQAWIAQQRSSGSFDEWYVNEQSFCPTAITSAGVALTLKLLGDHLPKETSQAGLEALARAGHWLNDRYNPEVMNQNLAAAAALNGLAALSGEDGWHDAADKMLKRVRSDQNSEGWLPEYGGADFGYSTLALDFLATSDFFEDRGQAREIAKDLIGFLDTVRGRGPILPGRLGSRGTSHQFALGAAFFSGDDKRAARLARRAFRAFRSGHSARPSDMDDRYFAYFSFPQWAMTTLAHEALEAIEERTAADEAPTDLGGCGFHVVRRPDWSTTISRRLGGAIAFETPDKQPRYQMGYLIEMIDGRIFASATWDGDTTLEPIEQKTGVTIVAPFKAVSTGVPLKRLMVPFQTTLMFLRTASLAAKFQKAIKSRMVSPKRTLPLNLERKIKIDKDMVTVEDTFILEGSLKRVKRVHVVPEITMHSPSSRQDKGVTLAMPDERLAVVAARFKAGKKKTILPWRYTPAKDLIEVANPQDVK